MRKFPENHETLKLSFSTGKSHYFIITVCCGIRFVIEVHNRCFGWLPKSQPRRGAKMG